jgi:hypothetical protein
METPYSTISYWPEVRCKRLTDELRTLDMIGDKEFVYSVTVRPQGLVNIMVRRRKES